MIVVDCGCLTHGAEESERLLIRTLRPDLYLGFDPHPELEEGVFRIDGTTVVRSRLAAWTYAGTVPLAVDTTTTGVDERPELAEQTDRVASFDLAALLVALPRPIVLKLDVEGAEYPLLERIAEQGVDRHLDAIVVEWHPVETAHGYYRKRPRLACPVREWP